jgi:transposase-like protein
MARIARDLSDAQLDDFSPVGKVAKEIGVHPSTLKRWLTEKKVPIVTWGRDRRNWIYVMKEHVKHLRKYKNSINLS